MMLFAPFAPAPGRETVPLPDALGQVLVAIYSPTMVAEQSMAAADAPAVASAVDDVAAVTLAALKEDRLAAHCSPVGHTLFYRIPLDYWWGQDADLSLTGELFSFPNDRLVPPILDNTSVFVFADDLALFIEQVRIERGKPIAVYAGPTMPWTEEAMIAAIAACGITNCDAAWKDHFAGRLSEHGWSNEGFRALWSRARGTKGMKGRPARN